MRDQGDKNLLCWQLLTSDVGALLGMWPLSLLCAALAPVALALSSDELAAFSNGGCAVNQGTCASRPLHGFLRVAQNAATLFFESNRVPDHATCEPSRFWEDSNTCYIFCVSTGAASAYDDACEGLGRVVGTNWIETAENYTLRVPRAPALSADGPTCAGGTIGMATNGVPFQTLWTSACVDAAAEEHPGFDDCGGHPNRVGQYHYHQLPPCIAGELVDGAARPDFEFPSTSLRAGAPSGVIGVALDGFPM